MRKNYFAGYCSFRVINSAVPTVTTAALFATNYRGWAPRASPRFTSAAEPACRPNCAVGHGKERASMSAICSAEPIRIGVVANEPMRLEGLTSIFENHAKTGEPSLL